MKYETIYKYLRTVEFWHGKIDEKLHAWAKEKYAKNEYKTWIEQNNEWLWNEVAEKIYERKPWLKG